MVRFTTSSSVFFLLAIHLLSCDSAQCSHTVLGTGPVITLLLPEMAVDLMTGAGGGGRCLVAAVVTDGSGTGGDKEWPD